MPPRHLFPPSDGVSIMFRNDFSMLGSQLPLTEYRQIELYSKTRKLAFAAPADEEGLPDGVALAQLSLLFLENHYAAQDPLLLESKSSWQRYLDLPRRNALERVVAELYRILRICRIATLHGSAHHEMRDGLVRLSCVFNRCSLSLNITPYGLLLVAAAVRCFLDATRQPYSAAYTEALLVQYYFDIVDEIRKFADEDRVLFQFQPKFAYFNRHFRFDCDNPKFVAGDSAVAIEIGAKHRDPVRYPIDFYLPLGEHLHIVPVEALKDGCIAVADLPAWQIRGGGNALPAHFAARFSREEMIVGLPMT